MKLSTKELQQYRVRLLEMRNRSRDEINRMIEVVRDDATALGEHDRKVSESADKEIALEQTEESIRRAILDALQRIEVGTFGQCQRCQKGIPKARLDAIPFTPFCVNCEREQEL